MEKTTEQYRSEMKLPFRGASSVYAYIGLINSDAQRNATITSSYDGSEEHLYDSSSASSVVSKEADGSMTFTFTDLYEINIAGLTLGFTTTPSSITVTNGTKTSTYVVNNAECTIDDGYTNCHYIKITPNSGKLSLNSITFGIGIQFGNRQILSTTRQNVVNHISNELPKKTFSLTINNRNNMFNKDNPYGYSNYLEEKQEIRFEYGREMSDGSIYKIKGGKVYLKNWTSDDYEARFSCVGKIDFLEGKYHKGQLYENGISAYDLATDVFEDAGITEYRLDDSLKKIQIYNPIPIVEYREALKMIANASRCVLYEDRDGNICITNANMPSYVGDVTFTGAQSYCIPSAIFDDNSLYNYADAEHEYVYADGSLLFLPSDESFKQVGFVSSQIANSSGLFTNNPHIDISFKSEFSLTKMILNFAVILPTSITITSKLSGNTVDTQTLTNLSMATVYEYEGMIDALTITFNSATANQRIHLNSLSLIGGIEYNLTYHELKDTPIASSLEKVANINVHCLSFNQEKMDEGTSKSSSINIDRTENEDGGETVNISTTTSEYGSAVATIKANVGDNLVTFDSPYYNYKISAGTIKESGVYYLVITSDIEQDIDVFAQPYSVTDNIYTTKVHEKGVDKEANNPLISNVTMARAQGEWLKSYYDDDLEYSLTYRGDPTLDADDLIYLENKFVANNEIRVVDESINTSMGMDFSCKLQARRTSYQVDAKLSMAILGRFRLGEVL